MNNLYFIKLIIPKFILAIFMILNIYFLNFKIFNYGIYTYIGIFDCFYLPFSWFYNGTSYFSLCWFNLFHENSKNLN